MRLKPRKDLADRRLAELNQPPLVEFCRTRLDNGETWQAIIFELRDLDRELLTFSKPTLVGYVKDAEDDQADDEPARAS